MTSALAVTDSRSSARSQYHGVDRAALRLGLALVGWSRRSRRQPVDTTDHHRLAMVYEQARVDREHAVALIVYSTLR